MISQIHYDELLIQEDLSTLENIPKDTLDIILILEDIEYHKKQQKLYSKILNFFIPKNKGNIK